MAVDKKYLKTQLKRIGRYSDYFKTKEIKELHNYIEEEETLLGITSGHIDYKKYIMVITDYRLILLYRKSFGHVNFFDINLYHLEDVNYIKKGLFYEIHLNFDGLEDTPSLIKITNMIKSEAEDISKLLRELIEDYENTEDEEDTINVDENKISYDDNVIGNLERLADLRERNILTEDEFIILKERILNDDLN